MRKLRHKQVKECARGRTARERRGQNLRPGALSAKCALSPAAPRGLLSAGVTVAEGRRKGRDTGGHRGGRGKGGGRWLRRGRRLPKPRGSASSHGTSARRPGPQVRGADTTGEREGVFRVLRSHRVPNKRNHPKMSWVLSESPRSLSKGNLEDRQGGRWPRRSRAVPSRAGWGAAGSGRWRAGPQSPRTGQGDQAAAVGQEGEGRVPSETPEVRGTDASPPLCAHVSGREPCGGYITSPVCSRVGA